MPSSIFSCQQGNAPINKISSICACVYLYTVYKLLICKSVPLWVNKRTFTNPCPQSEHYNKLCYGSYVWPVHIKVTVPTSEHANNKLAAKNPKNKTQRNAVYSAVWRKHEKTSVHICVCATSTCPVRKLECVTVRTRLCVYVCARVRMCVCESEREWVRESEGGLFVFTAISRISSYEGHWAAQQGGKHLRKQMESDSYQAAI